MYECRCMCWSWSEISNKHKYKDYKVVYFWLFFSWSPICIVKRKYVVNKYLNSYRLRYLIFTIQRQLPTPRQGVATTIWTLFDNALRIQLFPDIYNINIRIVIVSDTIEKSETLNSFSAENKRLMLVDFLYILSFLE